MKKIKRLIIILIISIVGLFNISTNVNAYSTKETFSSRVLSGFYIKKVRADGSGKYKSIGMITRNSDGHFVYCVQPWMDLDEQGTYDANSENQAEILGVSNKIWKRLSLIAYYGYGYPGHTDERWYGISQLMIWKTVDPTSEFYFTYTANGATDYRYDWMKDEIENLISNHYTEPNFNSTNITLDLGDSITITDTNGVLSDFTLTKDNNHIKTSKSGNNLTITANSVGSSKITLTKKISNEGTDNTTVLYNYLDKQKTISRGYVDPVDIDLKVEVIGGKIKLKKVDSETKLITAQGNASMVGAIYDIYDSNNTKVDTLTIGADSTAITKALKKGKYKIVESSSGNKGYKVNSKTYNVTISESKVYEIQVEDEVIKAKIRLYKYDSETKKCVAQGTASLVGAKYNVINSKNEVVDTLTIGNDCSATSKLLPYDKYKVKEINNPVGYSLDTNTYTVNIVNETQVDLTVYDNAIKTKLKLYKYDSETKKCVAQGTASLVGAKYNVINSKNEVVDTLTIGNDCSATSKLLPYDKYKVKEINNPIGYNIDTNTYTVNIVNSTDVDLIVYDEVVKTKIKLYKYDSKTKQCNAQGTASLVGAKYNVINSKNSVVDTLIIGNDCSATSKLLPYDRYTIKEINNPVGYNIDTNTYTVNETQVDLTVYDNVIQGKVKIYKKDADNNNTTARGQGSLIGAKYGLYDMNDNLIDTLVIGDNYQAISKSIPYGHYKIKEVEASEGYKLDTKVYEVNINEESEVEEITSKEKVVENHISLLKQYDYIDGQTAFLNAEADVKFNIYYPNGDLYTTITTNKHGYANILMPYGVWKFHQVNTHTGYEKIYDFYVTVNRESEEEQYYNILNNKIAAYLKVIKKDLETGKTIAIANTKFRIFNRDTNQYVSQYVSGKVYDTFTTDNDGTFTTYLKLEAGNYKLVEVSSPKNYLLNSEGLEFTIGEDTHYAYTTYGAIVTVEFYDKQIKGVIEINKTGEVFTIEEDTFNYNGRKNLEGIVYHIIAAEDIKSADGNYIYYQKDKLVDTLTTNNIGYAKSKQLPLGKYIVYEFSTIGNYILDSKQYEVELTEKDNRTEIVYSKLKLTNTLKKGDLEFTKTDLINGDVIPNTVIEIYTENDELIYHGKTDKDGKVTIKNLPLNTKFYIIEKDCEGYVITDDKVYFEIKEDGEIVKAEMKNKPITGDLEFTKLDYSNDEPIENTIIEIYNDKDELEFTGKTDKAGKVTIKNIRYGKHYILEKEAPEKYTINKEKMYFEIKEDGEIVKATMKDKVKQGTLVFTKTDISESETLPNTVIEIYTENDELIYHGKTDKNGKIVLPELEYGKYYILEKEAPEKYTINKEKMYFEIKEDGEIVKATMKDKVKQGTLVFTKTDISESETLPNTVIEIYTENDELIYHGKTDKNGKIVLPKLEYGKYYILEKEAPEGYELNEEKMYFEIKEDGEIVKATMKDKVIPHIDVPDTDIKDSNHNFAYGIEIIILGILTIVYAIIKKKKKK